MTFVQTSHAPDGVNSGMKRASVTFSDEVEGKLNDYLERQSAPPSLSTLVNIALADYLERQRWLERGHRAAEGELELFVSDAEVEPDVSVNHDAYL